MAHRRCARLAVVKHRAAREAAIQLADSSSNSNLREVAIVAHGEFLDLYHRLALDADRQMLDVFTLRAILGDICATLR
jgi:hypothetical protein